MNCASPRGTISFAEFLSPLTLRVKAAGTVVGMGRRTCCTANCCGTMFQHYVLQVKMAGMVVGMGEADLLHAAMHRTGDFSLLKFLPATTLAVTTVAAGPERHGFSLQSSDSGSVLEIAHQESSGVR